MAYLFGTSGDLIDAGHPTEWVTRASLYVRARFDDIEAGTAQLLLDFGVPSGDSVLALAQSFDVVGDIAFGYLDTAAGFPHAAWSEAATGDNGVFHSLMGVIDLSLGSANIKLYADGDATPKATANTTVAVSTTGTPVWRMGNHRTVTSLVFVGQLLEVGYWPEVALTGAEAAAITSGDGTGIALPSNYWPLISDAVALYGGLDGAVTGGSFVGHTGDNVYPLAGAAPTRRSLALLGVG